MNSNFPGGLSLVPIKKDVVGARLPIS